MGERPEAGTTGRRCPPSGGPGTAGPAEGAWENAPLRAEREGLPSQPPVHQTPGNGPPGQGPEAARFRKRNKKDVVLCAGMI